jgi:hypothetical protein
VRVAEQQPSRRPRCLGCVQPLQQLCLGLRPDPGHVAESPRLGSGPQLARRAHVEGTRDLQRALRREPEEAAEADDVGRQLALELFDLGDLARLDELLQTRLDAGTDASELAHAPLADELGHRRFRLANERGGATVCPSRERIGARQLDQRRERLEAVSDCRICELVW